MPCVDDSATGDVVSGDLVPLLNLGNENILCRPLELGLGSFVPSSRFERPRHASSSAALSRAANGCGGTFFDVAVVIGGRGERGSSIGSAEI